jgi:hypothetical protein
MGTAVGSSGTSIASRSLEAESGSGVCELRALWALAPQAGSAEQQIGLVSRNAGRGFFVGAEIAMTLTLDLDSL